MTLSENTRDVLCGYSLNKNEEYNKRNLYVAIFITIQ